MSRPDSEERPVVVRRLNSITPAQVGIVVRAVAALPGAWWVEPHDDYDGFLSLVVSRDGDGTPTFALFGKADRIELTEVRGDVLYPRGCFADMGDAADALVVLLRTFPA